MKPGTMFNIFTCTVLYLYNAVFGVHRNHVISKWCYKGKKLRKGKRKMTILWPFSCIHVIPLLKFIVNLCMPNGISHLYRLDESISNLRVTVKYVSI